ncbi:MAG: YitT family protein [Eubacteriales bacterium]|nr:YitT family protein [Eubacteriales bacterium]
MRYLKKMDPRFLRGMCTLGGILLYALALDLFLVGNNIAAGGLSGIAVVLRQYVPISVGLMIYIMNVPILVAALVVNGWKYTVWTIVGATIYSAVTELFAGCPTLTHDPLAAAVFGGAIYGLGMALLTFGDGSTGGTDLLSRLFVKKFPSMSVGKMCIVIDGTVIVLAILSFGNVEVGLYAILTIFVCSCVYDWIILGFKRGCICLIITSHDAREVAAPLMQALRRGVTRLNGTGMYAGLERSVLLVAVRQQEVPKVKTLLRSLDEDAFVMLRGANEIIGGNFKINIFPGIRP